MLLDLAATALGVQSRLEEAIAYFGTARRLYEAGELEWKLAGLFTARQLEKLRSQRLTQAEEILKQCAGNGWLALTPEDPCYPKRLRAIPNFPAALYVWGRMPDLDGRVALAVVGAREASFQGRQIAQGLCKAFAQAGAVVVSGGALGIDSAAHMGALEGGGETVAFLGCGLGARYLMENQYLRESIAAHGAVVSEFPPGTPPGRTTFPVRNRLLSGVSCGTVVIEAGEKSGSLITARCALEQGPGRVRRAWRYRQLRLYRSKPPHPGWGEAGAHCNGCVGGISIPVSGHTPSDRSG